MAGLSGLEALTRAYGNQKKIQDTQVPKRKISYPLDGGVNITSTLTQNTQPINEVNQEPITPSDATLQDVTGYEPRGISMETPKPYSEDGFYEAYPTDKTRTNPSPEITNPGGKFPQIGRAHV